MKKLLLIILVLTTQVAIAQEGQYQLVVTSVSYSGNCGGMKNVNDVHGLEGALQKAISIGMSQSLNGQIYPSEDICKSALHSMSGSYGGCTTKVSGYCRPLGGGRTSVGRANVLGVGQGSSFYSINGANEIKNWSEDDAQRRMGFDSNFQSTEPTNVSTGDTEFDNVRSGYILSGSMSGGSLVFIEKPLDNKNQDLEDYMIVGGARIPVSVLNNPFNPKVLGEVHSDDLIYDAYEEMKKREEERRQRELEWEHKEASVWDEIRSKLDDENFHLLAYILQTNNGGVRPKFLGITESGRYIFESIDGNNVFSISKDAKAIQTLTFEEHSWKDDNIIKAIQENGFKDAISDRYKFEYPSFDNIKGGKISFKDLKNLSTNELRKLLPYIKGELKLKLFDNSSELSYEYVQLSDWHGSGGFRTTLSSGGKDNISASLSVTGEGGDVSKNSDTFFDNKEKVFSKEHDDSELKKEYAIFGGFMKIKGKLNAEIELSSLQAKVTGGYVKKVYGGYLYCSGGAEVKGGTHVDKTIAISPWNIFYVKGKVGGFQCKNITNSTDNIPTLKR